MRGVGERSRIEELEDQVILLRLFARRLWASLRRRQGAAIDTLLDDVDDDLRRAADPAYDAAETVWAKHKVRVEPCRTVLDPGGRLGGCLSTWPIQSEAYVGYWPDGTSRNLTREQLLMMGGQDVTPADGPAEQVPF